MKKGRTKVNLFFVFLIKNALNLYFYSVFYFKMIDKGYYCIRFKIQKAQPFFRERLRFLYIIFRNYWVVG
jgi:hypothetical protein